MNAIPTEQSTNTTDPHRASAIEIQSLKATNRHHWRNFRLLWIGDGISTLGDQFALIAFPWLVLQLTNDGFALGLIIALINAARALFTLVGGALVDRFSPRRVMFASNIVRMFVFVLLAILVLTGQIQLWMVFVLGLIFGAADALYYPAQTAILPRILAPEQLAMGNTLVQGLAEFSLFVGPVIAGSVIALVGGSSGAETSPSMTGIGVAFGIDAFSFLASLIALYFIHAQPAEEAEFQPSMLESIKTGIVYVWSQSTTRLLFVLAMIVNLLFSGPFWVGVPVLANVSLVEKAAAYGIVVSAFGAGSLIGMVLAGVLFPPRPGLYWRVLLGLVIVMGTGLILIPATTSTLIVSLAAALMGLAYGYMTIATVTRLQKQVPGELLGRVMGLLMFASMIVSPLSSLLAGALVNVSLSGLFVIAGALMISASIALTLMPSVRRLTLSSL